MSKLWGFDLDSCEFDQWHGVFRRLLAEGSSHFQFWIVLGMVVGAIMVYFLGVFGC